MAESKMYATSIQRFYIDTRTLVPPTDGNLKSSKPSLPLLDTLPVELQTSITRFIRSEDKFMSLASALLKYTYIHRTAKIPWKSVQISKTPRPHGRPYWDPPCDWHGENFNGIEFNVSHQAGVVILAGCRTPERPAPSSGAGQSGTNVTPDPAQQQQHQIRIGVDVACTKEPRRTPDLSTQAKLNEWVDTFAEMFSARERRDMKQRPAPSFGQLTSQAGSYIASQNMEGKARRFYTYWALKEAYIKMVGEGLLADWLRELEFVNVTSPDPGERLSGAEIMMQVMFKGRDISDSVEVELEGYEDTFLFTMITRGISELGEGSGKWVPLNIEKDIRSCAEGTCSCLN